MLAAAAGVVRPVGVLVLRSPVRRGFVETIAASGIAGRFVPFGAGLADGLAAFGVLSLVAVRLGGPEAFPFVLVRGAARGRCGLAVFLPGLGDRRAAARLSRVARGRAGRLVLVRGAVVLGDRLRGARGLRGLAGAEALSLVLVGGAGGLGRNLGRGCCLWRGAFSWRGHGGPGRVGSSAPGRGARRLGVLRLLLTRRCVFGRLLRLGDVLAARLRRHAETAAGVGLP